MQRQNPPECLWTHTRTHAPPYTFDEYTLPSLARMAFLLRSGLVGETQESDAELDMLDTVAALLRLFTKDSLVVAGRYACAHGRDEVTAKDMRAALMYCARTFFEKGDAELEDLVEKERQAMAEEDSEEDDGEEDEEPSDQSQDEESSASTDGAEGGAGREVVPTDDDRRLAQHVDTIVRLWDQWHPTDPVHCLIKRAIDHGATE